MLYILGLSELNMAQPSINIKIFALQTPCGVHRNSMGEGKVHRGG